MNYQLTGLGESGVAVDSEYDFSDACEICGTGAMLVGQLRVKGIANAKKDIFLTQDNDWLISNDLYKKLQSELPMQLSQVTNLKGEAEGYWLLTGKLTLPKSTDGTSGLLTEDQCERCKRDGHFNDVTIGDIDRGIKSEIRELTFCYQQQTFPTHDELIYNTWECSGLSNRIESGSRVQRIARPWLIVSKHLKNALENFGIRKVEFLPVKLV